LILIDEHWLHERGGLHDAHVTGMRFSGGTLEIDIDDEWSNERGLSRPQGERCPLTFKFCEAVVDGELSQAGWISEIEIRSGGSFQITFTDRDAMNVIATAAEIQSA
jgi:hypothetical protein